MLIYCEKSISATVPFCVCVGDKFFPSKDWEDFYISIIIDWISIIYENTNKNTADFRLDFMDGPYYLLCTKNYDKVTVFGIYDGKQANAVFLETISFEYLTKVILDLGEAILAWAHRNQYCNQELKRLTLALEQCKV